MIFPVVVANEIWLKVEGEFVCGFKTHQVHV